METVVIALNQIVVKKITSMKTKTYYIFIVLIALFVISSCQNKENKTAVTFIELGSVKCIPCQKMQSVIKKVEENYPNQVKTIFYDVWTEEGEEASKGFEFEEIPTQIFLDADGKEYYRHVGYFPYKELEQVLKQKL